MISGGIIAMKHSKVKSNKRFRCIGRLSPKIKDAAVSGDILLGGTMCKALFYTPLIFDSLKKNEKNLILF